MKHLRKTNIALAIIFAGSVVFTSCGDSSDDNSGDNNMEQIVDPVTPDPASAMSPADQKERLENIALELMDKMPETDFKEISSLGKYIDDTYSDYDWSNVGDWGQDIFEASRKATGTKTENEEETGGWGNEVYVSKYIYSNYEALIMASNFKGHFTAKNGAWALTEADDLQFVFNDANGAKCVLKVEVSGNVKKVRLFSIEDWTDYAYDVIGNKYIFTDYYDLTQYTIGVPEQIKVTLTQGGKQVVATTVKIDLASIDSENFDISKSNFTASATTELNNGYKFETNQVKYEGNKNAAVSVVISKNGTNLMAMGIAADVSGLPSCNVGDMTTPDFNGSDYDTDKANAKNAYVKLDILGKMQIQGVVSDVRKFAEHMDSADENCENETQYKSYIDKANALMDVNLFYDGQNTRQATVKLEPFMERDWYGDTYWTAEPVLTFYDGSSYSTFEAFFNEDSFKQAIDTFDNLTGRYADLVEE